MKIYTNIGSDAEIISDSYKMFFPEEFKGTVAEVQSRLVIVGDVNVDVGCGNAFGGKNEDDDGGMAGGEAVEKVNDLIDNFGYVEWGLSKAEFQNYIKGYLKAILPKIPETKQADFKAGAQAFVKKLLGNFGEYTIYTPKDNSAEGALIYSIYKNEEDPAPTFYYLIEGLPFIKV